ncbi:MAG: hypothetical protein H7Y86_21675 [Rhizobacter sp.]|nr:hypothetical protein [Ferruginibacter sp.]
MYTDNFNASTKSGTLGGTLLVLLFQLSLPELLQTIIVAAVGATTSFLVSMCLRYVSRKFFK